MAESLCEKCAALCCRYFRSADRQSQKRPEDYDNIRWYLVHENVVAFIENKKWFVGVMTRCKHLQADNRCGIYETRPRICRKYSTDNCDYHRRRVSISPKLFTSADDLKVYAEKKLGRSILPLPKRA